MIPQQFRHASSMEETWFSPPSCLNFLLFTLLLANREMCSLSKYKTPQSPEILQMLACTFSFSVGFLGHCKILLDLGSFFAQVPLFSMK